MNPLGLWLAISVVLVGNGLVYLLWANGML